MKLSLKKFLGALALVALAACTKAPEPVKFIAEGRPAKLSEWHVLHADGKQLKLNQGVEPYELNTALFSDHAHKLRTVWMPAGQASKYDAQEAFDFPVGTIVSKTFYYPRSADGQLQLTAATPAELKEGALDLKQVRLIETRLLVRRAGGWIALPYVWNADQTEAELMRTGDQQALSIKDEKGAEHKFPYVVPNENQCASCHVVKLKSKDLMPIGLKARHLNRDGQLERMVKAGYLTGLPATDVPAAANWADTKQPLEARARAYLDINCAHCHNPRGSASNTALNLEPFLPASHKLGLCKPPVAAGKGTGDRLFGIVPGKPDESIMAFRMASREGGIMMPELGRSIAHDEGTALIREWIAAMPGHCQTITQPGDKQ